MTAQTCRERNKQLFSLIGRERQRLFSNDLRAFVHRSNLRGPLGWLQAY